jgi:phytol kinase
MSPPLILSVVAAGLAALLGALAWAGRRLAWAPELRRKAAHIALGLGCAAFPWVFTSPAPVWTLAALACAGLALLRLRSARATTLGSALHDVARRSWGELVFPLAVALVFHASAGRWELYVPPLLVLALADAAGALVGRRFGRHPLRMEGAQRKSLEGSLAVFAVAAPCVALPLALFAGWAWPLALAVALLAAGLAALVEGVAIEGLDNLFLPLLAFAVLARAEAWAPAGVLARLAYLVGIIVLVAFVGRRLSPLTDAALMGLALALYLFASLGGAVWLVGPLALAAFYLALNHRAPDRAERRHPLAAVVAVAAAPLAWLALAPRHASSPALAAFSAQAVLMLIAERGRFLPRDHHARWLAQASLGGAASLLGHLLA